MFNNSKITIKNTNEIRYTNRHKDYNSKVEHIAMINLQDGDSTEHYNQILSEFPELKMMKVADYIEVPLEVNMIGMGFIDVIVNKEPMKFLFDTGAQVTCINEKHLHEQTEKHMVNVGSSAGEFSEMNVICLHELEVLNYKIENLPTLVLGSHQLSVQMFGNTIFDINGIIGWDILKHLDFSIDYKNDKITVKDFEVIEDDTNLIESDFPTLLLIDEKDKLHVFGIDTGARSSWLNHNFVNEAHLKVVMTKAQKNLTVHGVINQTISIIESFKIHIQDRLITFKNIKTGATSLLNDSEFDGIIGHDMLRGKTAEFITSQNIFRIR